VMLPHTLAYNAASAPDAMSRAARALGTAEDRVPEAIHELMRATGAPLALKELGLPLESLDRVADLAVQNPYPNPRPLDRAALRAMLQLAYEGAPPLP
jgi:maleylacetate reductase